MLTELSIREAKPKDHTYFLWGDKMKGLGVRITPGGTKSYTLDYAFLGRNRRITLGRAGEMSLREARQRAAAELVRIRAGESDPMERRREGRDAPTVAAGLSRFFNEYGPRRIANGRMTPSTLNEYRKLAAKYVSPALGSRRVTEVTRRQIEVMVEPLPRVQHNRVLAFTSRLFNLFEAWEWRPQHTNPVRGIERAVEQPRDRVLAVEELAALATVLACAEAEHPASVAAIRFAVLTGLRIGEVLAVKWSDIDDAGMLTLPTTKTGRRSHDLPSAALGILNELPRFSRWAFASELRPDAPLVYNTVRRNFLAFAADAGIADVRLHDLRRTVMTMAARSGASAHVMRDLLGHKTLEQANRYVRDLGGPVRQARDQVGSAIAAAMHLDDRYPFPPKG